MQAEKTNVLLVGSGGREHALAWKLSQSRSIGSLCVAPGNAGTAKFNVPIAQDDIEGLADFAEENDCFTVVGPEDPLCYGLVDAFRSRNLRAFGPRKEQAMLEGSKSYAKKIMASCKVPTATFEVFEDYEQAKEFSSSRNGEVVVKADGLARGKGVFVCSNQMEVDNVLKGLLVQRSLGEAGKRVVIEEKLLGQEASFMALCDGKNAVGFGTATDYKQLFDGDKGPNTGGMGSCSPAIVLSSDQESEVLEKIVNPIVQKTAFKGFLYVGLMISDGKLSVLEFNVRLGDPETQSIIPRLENDLLDLLTEIEYSGIGSEESIPKWSSKTACSVVMCSQGYPGKTDSGMIISGIDEAESDGAIVFHSGTRQENQNFVTNGGRVLSICAIDESLEKARSSAYRSVEKISWRGEYHRSDIGRKLSGPIDNVASNRISSSAR